MNITGFRATLRTLGAAVPLLMLAGCSDHRSAADPSAADASPAGADATGSGHATTAAAATYQTACAGCHEGQVSRAPHRAMLEILSPASVYRALTVGVMQQEASDLSESEIVQLVEYLTERPFDGDLTASATLSCTPEVGATLDRARPPFAAGWGLSTGNGRFISREVAGLEPGQLDELELKWAFAFPDASRARSAPMIAGGRLFVGSHSGAVYALDPRTGCTHWAFQASSEVRTGIVVTPWSEAEPGTTIAVYFGDLLGNVYAVDAETGELLWRDRPDPHPNATITGTPALYRNQLLVPISSLEVVPAADPQYPCCTFRGSVVAYDARSGTRQWQAFTIDTPAARTGQNRSGTDQYGPSGAPIWNSPSIDPARDQLYVGTGENYSSPATETSDAILAIDLQTGKIRWRYQATQQDAWNLACGMENDDNCPAEDGPDFDFGAATILATAANGRDLVLAGQKSGIVHALDPDSGELIWKTRVGRGGIQGGVHFGMAVSGEHLLVPINDMDDGRTYPDPARPGLHALALASGEPVWTSPADGSTCRDRAFCNPGISSAITATPGLVLAGGMDGIVRIHSVHTGEVLWQYDTTRTFATVSGDAAQGGSIGGAAGPILADGMLYVNSGYGIYDHMPGNVLLAFGIRNDATN